MKLEDNILICRNSILYRANVGLLSSVVCFKTTEKQIEKKFEALSSATQQAIDSFSDMHYSKTEMKNEFCTISSINGLTDNFTYATKKLATQKANQLSSKQELDSWQNYQSNACFEVLSQEYLKMKGIVSMEQNKHTAEEYVQVLPSDKIEQIINGKEGDPYPIEQK